MSTRPYPIRATEIAQYVRHHSCERRLRLEYNEREATDELPFAERLFNSLDPVLQERGRILEEQWAIYLQDEGVTQLEIPENDGFQSEQAEAPNASIDREEEPDGDAEHLAWHELETALAGLEVDQSGFAREVRIEGNIGVFDVSGRIDFVILRWEGSEPKLRIVETKSSRKDKTNHYIQLATYKLLVEQHLNNEELFVPGGIITSDDVEYVVARIDESTNQIEDILELDPLELGSETSDVEELLRADSTFERVVTTDVEDIDELDYQLNPKCDQCVFDIHCLPESGRQRKLELLGLSPTTVRVLEEQGIETIDDLAELDLDSPIANAIRRNRSIQRDVQDLRARADARRQTLPRGEHDPDGFPVEQLPSSGDSQLPEHEIDGNRVIRVYLNVDYDYTEDRVVALAAHVTRSDWEIETPVEYEELENGWNRDTIPQAVEVPPRDSNIDAEPREIQGEQVFNHQPIEWSGDYDRDTASETNLIHNFLYDLIDAITLVAENDREYIHFYVWAQSEIDHLINAASRAGTPLLRHLRELLGCREPLEQLIYSSIRQEVDNRYALGWTGRGLSVVTDLRWFGNEYHWDRLVAGETVSLDRSFEQDVFDFKTTLGLTDENEWMNREDAPHNHRFELRSRFFDSLPVPYMHVLWDSLPEPDEFDNPRLVDQIRRYHRITRLALREYLGARTHALRWVDEQIRYHNDDITKRQLEIENLGRFDLDVEDAARAAIDFLLLDNHVSTAEWFTENMQPMAHRVPQGEALPLRDGVWEDNSTLLIQMDFEDFDISADEFRLRTSFDEGSFTRVSPAPDDPQRGPTFGQLARGGNIFVIEAIDWTNGIVRLSGIYTGDAGQYQLRSRPSGGEGNSYYDADTRLLLTDSTSDFTADKVHRRLASGQGEHALRWLDPENPAVPGVPEIENNVKERYRRLLRTIDLGDGNNLQNSQTNAIINGLETRVHLIHGPPGTGKTTTTAHAILLRILDRLEEGDTVILSGNTHRAIDNLLLQIHDRREEFETVAERLGYDVPNLNLVKTSSNPEGENDVRGSINITGTGSNILELNEYRQDGILLLGGTVSSVLKQVRALDESATFGGDNREFLADELIVDEASMLVFPHFLALATTVGREGRILLSGDHRQLSPIVAHDWEEEDRPPVQLYQPYASAFEAVQDLSGHVEMGIDSIHLSRLHYSFRLPPVVRALITQLYEAYDQIPLEGEQPTNIPHPNPSNTPLESIWEQESGLFLITHSERESRVSNPFEAQIIAELLDADSASGLADDSVSVLTPHTAQRSYLREILADQRQGPINVIDTVERLQGGESENIIVSATASDPTAIGSNEEFLLDLNRSNVAFSRTQQRLIIICSESFLNHIPPEIEEYNAAMLWKSLRSLCSVEIGQERFDEQGLRVFVPNPEAPEIQELFRRR
ncbi:AAA domain-containing protein [Haladaptatus sp. YSMS36]|uniref:AAA domain-containing protein n=1 Tax=Haladaptatus sp. YSMS36 TaxID=3033384 RepID=UPI0023E822F7|nr:AAA domain-containing protein [Haladaptatus sp. YSMS36]